MNARGEHLSRDLIQSLLESQGKTAVEAAPSVELRDAQEHLKTCEFCQKRLRTYSEAQQGLDRLRREVSAQQGPNCPSEREWLEIAAGLTAPEEAENSLAHAAQCDHCGPLLRQATEDFADELTEGENEMLANLESAKPEWQKGLVNRLSATSRSAEKQWEPAPSRKGWVARPRWVFAAVAASVVAAVGLGTWWWSRPRPQAAEQLLAQAYTEQRTIELRIPGARYAPLSTQRGGGATRHSELALLKAKVMIESERAAHPDDPTWMAAQGRAQLVEGRFADARRSLENALKLEANLPAVLTDLATAYFEMAQQQGRDDFYQMAAAKLSDALKMKPDDPIALFNRAIVFEHIGSYPLAIEDWERYLRVDPQSDWARGEARERLERLKKLVQQKDQALRALPADAAGAMRWLSERAAGRAPVRGLSADALDEHYLEIALTQWLPALFSSEAGNGATVERGALSLLAGILQLQHGDRWLADLLAAPPSPEFASGINALTQAITANGAGDPIEAEVQAKQADKVFQVAGSAAGALRGRLELVYAFHRTGMARPCLAEAAVLERQLERLSYTWAQAQLLIEESLCWGMLNEFGKAQRILQRGMTMSDTSNYGTLYLRSLGMVAGFQTAQGNDQAAWRLDRTGLERYWTGLYPPMRAYQFYSDMGFAAEQSGQWQLAEAMAREAVMMIVLTPSRSIEAMARYRLATDASLAGTREEAREEFERTSQLFTQLPANEATQTYQMDSQLYLAELEAQNGYFDRALSRLRRIMPQLEALKNQGLALHFYRTLGEAELRAGHRQDAERALQAAVTIAEHGLGSLAGDRDRVAWDTETGNAYRIFVELRYLHEKDTKGALELWEWYRASPVRDVGASAPRAPRTRSSVARADSHDAQLPPFELGIDRVRPSFSRETVVSYAVFSKGLVIWVFDDRGVQSAWVAVDRQELEKLARRFGGWCADPGSNLAALQRDGRQLYEWLVAPVVSHLATDRTLVFETDGAVSEVPMQALVDSSGNYLVSRFAMAFSPGIGYGKRLHRAANFANSLKALVVGSPTLSGQWAEAFPPLPDTASEAQAVAARFEKATVLLGNRATVHAVRQELPSAEVFHFAGHALAGGKQQGLLLAATVNAGRADDDDAGGVLLAASRLDPAEVRRCRLAVFSACSTAHSEKEALVDPESLVRGFLLAGVPHVVASRWNVDSTATTAFMDAFYSRLLSGSTVAAALQAAALMITQDSRTSHPYFWAAFSGFGQS